MNCGVLVFAGLLFGTTMIMVSIALVMSVVVTNLYLRKDGRKRVPYCVRKLFLPRPENDKPSSDDNVPHDVTTHHVTTPTHSLLRAQLHLDRASGRYSVTENHVDEHVLDRNCTASTNHLDCDQLSLKSLDADGRPVTSLGARLASPTTSCCRAISGANLRRVGSPVYRSHSHGRVPDVPAAGEVVVGETDAELWSLEWQVLAKRVDRVFFWLFLLTSIMALSTIFINIPRYATL